MSVLCYALDEPASASWNKLLAVKVLMVCNKGIARVSFLFARSTCFVLHASTQTMEIKQEREFKLRQRVCWDFCGIFDSKLSQ